MKYSAVILLVACTALVAAAPQVSSSSSTSKASVSAPPSGTVSSTETPPPPPSGSGRKGPDHTDGPAPNGTVSMMTGTKGAHTTPAPAGSSMNAASLEGLILTLDSILGTSFVNSIVSEVESIYHVGSTATGAQGSAYRSISAELPEITGSLLSYVHSVYGSASSQLSSLQGVTSTATGSALSAAKASISSIDSSISTGVHSQWNSITSEYSGVLGNLGVTAHSSGAAASSTGGNGVASSTYAGRADAATYPALGLVGSFVLGLAIYL